MNGRNGRKKQSLAPVNAKRLPISGDKIDMFSPVVSQQKQPIPTGPLNSTTINSTLKVMGTFLYRKKMIAEEWLFESGVGPLSGGIAE